MTEKQTAHEMLGNRDPEVCSCRACGWERGAGERYVSPRGWTGEQLARLPLERAESAYHAGRMSQEEYEAYRHVWATSTPRMSHLGHGWQDPPTDSWTKGIVTDMLAAMGQPA